MEKTTEYKLLSLEYWDRWDHEMSSWKWRTNNIQLDGTVGNKLKTGLWTNLENAKLDIL